MMGQGCWRGKYKGAGTDDVDIPDDVDILDDKQEEEQQKGEWKEEVDNPWGRQK